MNKKGVKNYLSITYSEDRRPKTDYPNKLASYLNDKYNLKRYKTLVVLLVVGDIQSQ